MFLVFPVSVQFFLFFEERVLKCYLVPQNREHQEVQCTTNPAEDTRAGRVPTSAACEIALPYPKEVI
jgi:hypothetical protein